MNIVNFITATELKNNTGASFNIDDSLINPMIKKAQDVYIGSALNSDFYEVLMDKSFNNLLSIDETTLIDKYIKPTLIEWSYLSCLSNIKSKTTNQGVVNESSQYAINADRADFKDKKQEIRDFAEFYLKRLNTYLCDYSELYPLYLNPSDKVNQSRNNTSYFSGIYIPKSNNIKRDDQYRNR